jgi:AraC family transcriptional regulator of arabinose operon
MLRDFHRQYLQLPPKDRPYWRAPEASSLPLLYLAWGSRQFGVAPIFPSSHAGWVCAVILKGSPTLVYGKKKRRVASPQLFLFGPDVAYGWTDESRQTSRLLIWMWRKPQNRQIPELERGSLRQSSVSAADQKILLEIHALCRRETELLDAHSPGALAGLQGMLEATLARMLAEKPAHSAKKAIARAQQWLDQHADSRQPLARLADYLALSPSTIQRLFRKQLGGSVTKIMAKIRQQKAHGMLASGKTSVKEVAFQLGYRHAHDFSRAFRRGTGVRPSAVLARRSK